MGGMNLLANKVHIQELEVLPQRKWLFHTTIPTEVAVPLYNK